MALRVSIGQYYAVDSPVHRLDPRVKLVGTIFIWELPACCRYRNGHARRRCACCGRRPGAHPYLARLLAKARPLAVFLVVTSLINLFCIGTGEVVWSWGVLRICTGGIEAAVLYTARFFLLLMGGSLLMFTTTPIALADAATSLLSPLERRGVRVGEAAVVFSIALCFVPALAREVDTIVAAQKATRSPSWKERGPWRTRAPACRLHVPLFASALRHAENLGRAMDARCYTAPVARTTMCCASMRAATASRWRHSRSTWVRSPRCGWRSAPTALPSLDRFRGICRAKWMFPQAWHESLSQNPRNLLKAKAETRPKQQGDARQAIRCLPNRHRSPMSIDGS